MNCHPVFGCSGHSHPNMNSELTNILVESIVLSIVEDIQTEFNDEVDVLAAKDIQLDNKIDSAVQTFDITTGSLQDQITDLVPTRDAYKIAVQNGYVGSEASWLDSLKGHSAYTTAKAHGFKGSESEWLTTLKGDSGPTGEEGAAGVSAYEVAKDNGFVGSEARWLNSLIGEKGDRGIGLAHVVHNNDNTLTFLFTDNTSYTTKSLKGEQGIQGVQGITPYEQAVEEGFNGTVTEWFTSLKPTEGTLQALTQFMNNDSETEVTVPELGNIPSLQGHIKQMFENGGIPATPFTTKALMTSSTLVDGDYAFVTNDADNNGLYSKTAGAWVKNDYDPLTQSRHYTDDLVKNNTVLSDSVDSKELAIFTDKNGRRTWIEVAADGGMTGRTKGLVRDTILTSVQTISFSYAVTDKNGRVLSGIFKDGNTYPKQSADSANNNNKRIKILGIGNSFTQDAFMYAPFLLKEMGVTNFEIVVLYKGGGTLEQHWDYASNDTSAYSLQVYKSENEAWQHLGSTTMKKALNYTDFDTITLQQQSARSCDYATYQPYLNNLVDYIYTTIDYPTRLGWHSIPASPDNGWSTTYPTSTEFYNAQLLAIEEVLRDTPVEYTIPTNTAIQNARGTVLGTLGDRSNMTYDGLHLQEGIPALVAAYAVTLKWLELFNLPKSIFGSREFPTDDWIATKNIQGKHGLSAGVTTDNVLITQKCAIAAIKNHFKTSTIN